ncbi:MAG: gliding motility lipoprotein GldH [Bacteroidales bacterium]
MRINITRMCCFVSLLLLLVSCNNDVTFDKSRAVDPDGWNMMDRQVFEVDISQRDIVYLHRFAINLRNTTEYKYNNIFFFVTTIYPDGSITKKDTVECILSDIDGTWKGKGMTDIKDNRFWFARNVKFPQKGKYIFKIEQATKDTILTGIKSVGLHVERQPL